MLELIDDAFIAFKSRKNNMTQPGKSTFEICWYIESYLKVFEGQKEFDFHSVLNSIMRN